MHCPVCLSSTTATALEGSDVLFETSTQRFYLQTCSECDCLFLNPLPSLEEITTFYPAQYWWSASRPTLLKRLEALYRRIALRGHVQFIRTAAQRLGPASSVHLLDVGCGSGTLIGLLQERGFAVLGVDTSEEASKVAKAESDVRVMVGTLTSARFDDGAFDMVTLFHVMEHVTNPRETLSEVRRILKPTGIVVVQVPNIDSWQFRWFKARWYGLDIPRHVVDYSRSSIVKLLERSGFTVRRIKHFNLRDNSPALVSSLFPSLDPLSRPIRLRRRKAQEAALVSWLKHLAYFVLVCAAYPITLLEAASGHGATVMIEAEKANPAKMAQRGYRKG